MGKEKKKEEEKNKKKNKRKKTKKDLPTDCFPSTTVVVVAVEQADQADNTLYVRMSRYVEVRRDTVSAIGGGGGDEGGAIKGCVRGETRISMSKGWTQQPEQRSDRQVSDGCRVRSKSGNPDNMGRRIRGGVKSGD